MSYKIALSERKSGLLAYKEVVLIKENQWFLDNVNIIIDGKVIKKIRFAEGEVIYTKGIGKAIVLDYLTKMIDTAKDKKPKKRKSNKKAAQKSAVSFMQEMGL